MARKRPDIQFVGDDLHPLARSRTFAPYVAKIKASGADSVITGNWGSDLTLLIKAANDAGLNVKFYTYYAGDRHAHAPSARPVAGRSTWWPMAHSNMPGAFGKLQDAFKKPSSTTTGTPRTCTTNCLLSRHGQGQEHRPGQGGGGHGGPEVQELQRRGRNAQGRPPAAAGAVHLGLAEGRRQEQDYSVENTGYTFRRSRPTTPTWRARPPPAR
jgi:branched-chain amino acid transport system substrate-binding protein